MLVHVQDCDGFTPLMRLVQRGCAAEAQLLLEAGDCNINAQAANTGATIWLGAATVNIHSRGACLAPTA